MKFVFATLAVLFSFSAMAFDTQGNAKGNVDVYPLQMNPKQMVIRITGNAAKKLWDNMSVEVFDLDGEAVQKSSGHTLCTKINRNIRADKYICEILVDDKGVAADAGIG